MAGVRGVRNRIQRTGNSSTSALEVVAMTSEDGGKPVTTEILRRLRKLCWLWTLILFLVGITVAYYFVSQDFDKLALIVLIAVTLIFAFFTYLQAEATRKMAKDLRDAKFASFQPVIVMGRNVSYGPMRDERQISEQVTLDDRTWLHNVGYGPALNLRFFLKEPNRKNPITVFPGNQLNALSTNESYELMLINIQGWKRKGRHDLVVEYEDVFGRRWCSGLELDYDAHLDKFAIKKFFYEKSQSIRRENSATNKTQA